MPVSRLLEENAEEGVPGTSRRLTVPTTVEIEEELDEEELEKLEELDVIEDTLLLLEEGPHHGGLIDKFDEFLKEVRAVLHVIKSDLDEESSDYATLYFLDDLLQESYFEADLKHGYLDFDEGEEEEEEDGDNGDGDGYDEFGGQPVERLVEKEEGKDNVDGYDEFGGQPLKR